MKKDSTLILIYLIHVFLLANNKLLLTDSTILNDKIYNTFIK